MAPAKEPTDETGLHPSVYNPEYLLRQSRWIRDDLDLQVARDGPDALHSNDILTLDEFLRRLLTSNINLEDLRLSRIHLAIDAIAGKATRWPVKLIDKAEVLRDKWEKQYGSPRNLTVPLYESGGRLYGIARPEDVTNEKLLVKWLKAPGVKLSPQAARRRGDLGFKPGDWWINPIFALQAGIIESAELNRGITFDSHGAYALLMTDSEEKDGASPYAFTYRCRSDDRGRYRLTSATPDSRQPVRILRGHSLRSFWAPKAGIRYDGLHRIAGWSIHRDAKSKEMVYEVKFERMVTETSMDDVLRRPFADEIEDYREYKRLRHMHREQPAEMGKARSGAMGPTRHAATDGTAELEEKLEEAEQLEEPESGQLPEGVYHAEMIRHRLEFGRSDSAVE